ncbi:MAG TPA: hypothetical protein VER39_11190 [Nocardioidaceae bacterium]|nr:hypothetical protein [Nocardioidaceae bacterium]
MRAWLAWLLWLGGAGCALCLAVGALLVALHLHQDDPVLPWVTWVLRAADALVLGRVIDLGRAAAEEEVVVSWGLAALGYLAVGTLTARLARV